MTISLSAEALTQISTHDVKQYVECKLYTASGTYLTDIEVQNVSYSKSRQFGVDSMNLQVINEDKEYTSGVNKIEQDCIIVLIEGYVTATATDKIPTFKGRVKDLNHTQAGDNDILNITCYGELMLLQRSDLNKIYVADTEIATNEILIPVIDNIIATIDGIITVNNVEYIKILDNGNAQLNSLMSNQVIYVEEYMMSIKQVPIKPINDYNGFSGIYVSNIVGTFDDDELLVTLDGTTFEGEYKGLGSGSGLVDDNYILLDNINGNPANGLTLRGASSGATCILSTYYLVKLINSDRGGQISSTILSVNDSVHNGIIDKFRAVNNDWAAFKTHKINVQTIAGDVSKDDRYDGYEITESLGIVKLNESVLINEKQLQATYNYYPHGLYIEDVITDIVTEPDGLTVDIIENGKFLNDTSNWDITENGITTADYTYYTVNGINITAYKSTSTGEYISIGQTVTLLSGYTYTYDFNIEQLTGTGALYRIYVNNVLTGNGTDFESISSESGTYISTLNGDYDFELRLYDLSISDKIRINDIKLNYSPAKIGAFTKENLYCKLSVEDGSAGAYSLNSNADYASIPRSKNLVSNIFFDTSKISLDNVTDLEASGYVQIDNEIISYSSINGTDLIITKNISDEIIGRGFDSTDITDHVTGKNVYQILPANRIWYLPYSNVIPESADTDASDYDYTGSMDLTTNEFTITTVSGGVFSEIFYREGIVITTNAVSGVTLDANNDYVFNQIQTTGIETQYILIDYKEILNRYDALSEVRSMLAPNFSIDEVVRKDGSNYTTFIRGRYLLQESTADYDLKFITDITYSEPTNNYNRVKMFGRAVNPDNLMYNDNVAVYNINELGEQYLDGVTYDYNQELNGEYVFTNGASLNYKYRESINIQYVKRRTIPNYNSFWDSATVNDSYQNTFSRYYANITYNGNRAVAGIAVTKSYSRMAANSSNYGMVRSYKMYNVYYVDYDSTSFTNGTQVTNGANSGFIRHIRPLTASHIHDAVLWVELDRTANVFTSNSSATNGAFTGTIYDVTIPGSGNTYNYNSQSSPTPSYYGTWTIYDVIVSTANDSIDFELAQVDTHVYINGMENTILEDRSLWSEELLPVADQWYGSKYQPHGVFSTNYRKRMIKFDHTNMYLNTEEHYRTIVEPTNMTYGTAQVGTFQLEYHNAATGKVDVLYTLRYIGEPGIDICAQRLHGNPANKLHPSMSKALMTWSDGGYLWWVAYDEKLSNANGKLAIAIRDCNFVRFYTKYDYNIGTRLDGDLAYVNKVDLDGVNLKPADIKLTVDGTFIVNIPDEYDDDTIPVITRLRNNYNSSRDTQVSVVSKTALSGTDLFVVDLGEVQQIGLIDLQSGFLYKPTSTSDKDRYPVNFKASLYYCIVDEDFHNIDSTNDFTLISTDTEDISMGNGNNEILTDKELGEYFSARYIKVRVSTSNEYDISEGTETDTVDYYGAAISSIGIYNNGIISAEKYVNTDVINLYKDTTVYNQLYTQELVDTYAQANLDEFQKDGTTVTINSPTGIHLDVGMTVRLNDQENDINELYFIEEISTNNGATTTTLARYV